MTRSAKFHQGASVISATAYPPSSGSVIGRIRLAAPVAIAARVNIARLALLNTLSQEVMYSECRSFPGTARRAQRNAAVSSAVLDQAKLAPRDAFSR